MSSKAGQVKPDKDIGMQGQSDFGEWLMGFIVAGVLAVVGYSLIQASEEMFRQLTIPPPSPRLQIRTPPS